MSLAAFDFDGTLTEAEMINLLGRRAGVEDDVAAITEEAMAGEIEYPESLRRRVDLLSGLAGETVAEVFEEVELRPGVSGLLEDLSAAGTRTAILTGGFERGVRRALQKDGAEVDVIVANRLGVEDGALTGEVEGPLVDGTKDVALQALVTEFDTTLAETVAVGDGANDLSMLQAVGLGIGFQPTPAVATAVDVEVETIEELREVLHEHRWIASK